MTAPIQQPRPIEILLVEDNPGDVRLTKEAFREGRVRNHLCVVENGDDVLPYLRHQGKYAGAPRPDMILLDLNLPRRNGREVLEDIKRDPDLVSIPVVVLTTSKAEQDILTAYELHANCYINKPVDLDQFLQAVRSIEHFWLTVVTLPPNTNY